MPREITHSNGAVTDLYYDGMGSRVKKSVDSGSGAVDAYYIGDHFEVKGGMARKYIFAGNLRITQIVGGTLSYFHKDHLRSSTVMTDSSGSAIETTSYMPFGSVRSHSGTDTSDYRFTDQELDAENGLYNYNARLYDPFIGRFISPDTIVPEPYNPQSLNRDSYCFNNPLIYVDPSGNYNSTPGVYAPGTNPWSSVDWWNSVEGNPQMINFWGPVAGLRAYADQMDQQFRFRTATVTLEQLIGPDGKAYGDTTTSVEVDLIRSLSNIDQFMWDMNRNSTLNNNPGGNSGVTGGAVRTVGGANNYVASETYKELRRKIKNQMFGAGQIKIAFPNRSGGWEALTAGGDLITTHVKLISYTPLVGPFGAPVVIGVGAFGILTGSATMYIGLDLMFDIEFEPYPWNIKE